MLWIIDLFKKSLNDKDNNENMTSYQGKGSVKTILFDSVPIENYIFSLLHAEIGVGNKIVYTYFDWINERIEPINYFNREVLEIIGCHLGLSIYNCSF